MDRSDGLVFGLDYQVEIMLLFSRSLKWTHIDTMATPCQILEARTVLVMKSVE